MKAKRLTAIFLSVAILVSFAACTNTETENSRETSGGVNNTDMEQSAKTDVQGSSETAKSQSSKRSDGNSPEKTDSKTLVIYFSAANTDQVDAVTAATQVTDNTAAVQHIANVIHETVGGDIVKIIPSKNYSLEYNAVADEAKAERDNDERPKFEDIGVNIADYDTIYVGYPMWWYTMPMIMYTFFDTYDFSGKTLVPFNTHLGSGDGGTYQTIKELEPNANVLDGLAVSGST
ncbi:MAG: NAD(P)H-dependent oxidoreductase, partial [Clostridia bacterium]|nr:NAD(P)H-dependent oxidoreductase [Clostridia bacterium]